LKRALVGIAETKSWEVEEMASKGREFDLRRAAPVKRQGANVRARFQRFEEVTVIPPSGAQAGAAER
jgi:hypothetical protein